MSTININKSKLICKICNNSIAENCLKSHLIYHTVEYDIYQDHTPSMTLEEVKAFFESETN